DEPKAFSQEHVDDCDLCILLVAFRRGHVPDGETKSITQMEYEYAVKNSVDVLLFLLDDEAPWYAQFDDREKDPGILEWRADLREHHGFGLFGLEPKTVPIAPALTRWLAKKKDVEGPDISYWLGRPPSLEGSFVGREKEMKALASDFSNHRAAVVSGGAGTGKSRLAAEYAHECGLNGFWTDAGGTVAQTLAPLALALDVEVEGRSDDEIAAQVRKVLAGLAAESLWVVDNLADLGLVTELLGAAGPVQLLITTRDARRQLLSPQVAFLPLATLAPGPAVDLLCSRSDCDPKDAALPEIAEAVGRLPVSVGVAEALQGAGEEWPQAPLGED
ncbi:MAG: DUF4062 domain-containing protein, partial [Chloroflexi bacterium]|nr:DUF4062 domain-containing protein [Chloroflexota bacterium]